MIDGISTGRHLVRQLADNLSEVASALRTGAPYELGSTGIFGKARASADLAVQFVGDSGHAVPDVVRAHDLITEAATTGILPSVAKVDDVVTGLRLLGTGTKVDALRLAPSRVEDVLAW